MEEIGAVDAKAHFSQILNAVEQGKSVVITRHGRKIAILKPISHSDEESNRFERAKKSNSQHATRCHAGS